LNRTTFRLRERPTKAQLAADHKALKKLYETNDTTFVVSRFNRPSNRSNEYKKDLMEIATKSVGLRGDKEEKCRVRVLDLYTDYKKRMSVRVCCEAIYLHKTSIYDTTFPSSASGSDKVSDR
jgi:hypothetical protein